MCRVEERFYQRFSRKKNILAFLVSPTSSVSETQSGNVCLYRFLLNQLQYASKQVPVDSYITQSMLFES